MTEKARSTKKPRATGVATTTGLIDRIAAKHEEIADLMRRLAEAADQRNALLRRDMVGSHEDAVREAERLFSALRSDVQQMREQIAVFGTLPPDLGRTLDTFEDELTHLKKLVGGPDDEQERAE